MVSAGEFEEVQQCIGPYHVPIKVYRNPVTHLRVITANTGQLSSGLVNGFFVLATEVSSVTLLMPRLAALP